MEFRILAQIGVSRIPSNVTVLKKRITKQLSAKLIGLLTIRPVEGILIYRDF